MSQAIEVNTYEADVQAGVSTLADPQINEQNNTQTPEGGEGEPTPDQPKQEEKKPEETIAPPQTQADAANALKVAGLDLTKYETEYMTNGTLSQDSYDELIKAGFPKTMVDGYIAGQQAITDKFINDIYAIAGGEEQYGKMTVWAHENLPQSERDAFDHVLASGNKELITLMATGIVSRWKAAEGSAPRLVQGKANAGGHRPQGFQSIDEMKQAMKDPRYGRDSAYTRDVERKAAISQLFG
jgi:hypothetical protein